MLVFVEEGKPENTEKNPRSNATEPATNSNHVSGIQARDTWWGSFKGELLNAFVKVIPNFYSCEANVEFTIVCFDGITPYETWPNSPTQ